MGKDEKALKQWFQLGQEIMSSTSDISAEDIDRFRRRPQGPHGHPMLVKSERLQRPHGENSVIADISVLPDGTLCTLWRLLDHAHGHALRVQIGEKSKYLGRHVSSTCDEGRIIGFNRKNESIVEMIWGAVIDGNAQYSMIYIGGRPIKHTLGYVYERSHQAWTMSRVGDLCCMEKDVIARGGGVSLVSYDAQTGAQVASVLTKQDVDDEVVESLAVRYMTEYAKVTKTADDATDSRNVYCTTDMGRAVRYVPSASKVVLTGDDLYLVYRYVEDGGGVALRLCDDKEVPLTRPYYGGLTAFENHIAYIGELPHEQVGWIIDGKVQPAFARVTNLFRHDDAWRYWALGNGHLFLMDLPIGKNKK